MVSDHPFLTIVVGGFITIFVITIIVEICRSGAAGKKAKLIRSRTDFNASDVYISPLDQHGLAIDSTAGLLLLVERNNQCIIEASDVVSVEVMADDTSLIKTNRRSQLAGAAVGGILLGPAGLLLGGLTGSKRSERRVKRLTLRITTTNFTKPHHDMLLYKSTSKKGDKESSILLKEPLRIAEAWHGRLIALIHNATAKIDAALPASGFAFVADELHKLNAARQEGLLTDAEFAHQKQRLLGND
jgi:hypothetical protein